MMLLYLSSNQNIGIFDSVAKEQGILVKKLSGEFHFKSFVIRDMRSLNHYEYVAIDLKAIKDTEEEFIEALIAFKSMYDSRIIIYGEGLKQGNVLLNKLVDIEVYNLITSTKIETINQEIKKTLSPEGMTYQDVFKFRNETFCGDNKKQYSFICSNVQIAVAGVSSKVGATTIAFNMANYLASIGAKVYYVEFNKNKHLDVIASYYREMIKTENGYECKGVKYIDTSAVFNWDCNFIIFDLGVVTKEKKRVIESCKINVLCSTSKPYELSVTKDSIKIYDNQSTHLIFSFTEDQVKSKLKREFENKNTKVHFANYSPDLFNGKANEKIFREIFNDYIIENKI